MAKYTYNRELAAGGSAQLSLAKQVNGIDKWLSE